MRSRLLLTQLFSTSVPAQPFQWSVRFSFRSRATLLFLACQISFRRTMKGFQHAFSVLGLAFTSPAKLLRLNKFPLNPIQLLF